VWCRWVGGGNQKGYCYRTRIGRYTWSRALIILLPFHPKVYIQAHTQKKKIIKITLIYDGAFLRLLLYRGKQTTQLHSHSAIGYLRGDNHTPPEFCYIYICVCVCYYYAGPVIVDHAPLSPSSVGPSKRVGSPF
jgi:hypothetical protein